MRWECFILLAPAPTDHHTHTHTHVCICTQHIFRHKYSLYIHCACRVCRLTVHNGIVPNCQSFVSQTAAGSDRLLQTWCLHYLDLDVVVDRAMLAPKEAKSLRSMSYLHVHTHRCVWCITVGICAVVGGTI